MKLKYILRILGTLLIMALCIRFIDLREMWSHMKQIDIAYYLPSLLILFGSSIYTLYAIEKKIFHHYDVSVKLPELIKISFTLSLHALLFPRPVTMGIRWRKFTTFCSAKASGIVILVENIIQVTGIASTGLIFFIVEIKNIDNLAYIVPMILIIAAAGFIFFLIRKSPWRTAVEDLKAGIIINLLLYSIVGNLLYATGHFLLVKALGLDVSFPALVWIRSLAVLIQLIPVTIAGLGLREGTYMILLGLYGVRQTEAFTYSMGLFSYALVWAAIGALIELTDAFIIKRKGKGRHE